MVKDSELYQTLLDQIDSMLELNYAPPTVRELGELTGVSHCTVVRYLKELKEAGLVDYDGHRSLVTTRYKKMMSGSVAVPVVGEIACGPAIFAEENIESYVRLPAELFGRGDFFILKARGDSMIDAGIDSGDYVILRKQDTANPGEIVCALLGEEATLKRYYPDLDNGMIRLHAENSSWPEDQRDRFVNDCMVQGVAVKIIKSVA